MKNKLYYLIILSILIFVTLIFIKNLTEQINNNYEPFTPKIREMYRPFIRNTRITYQNMYDNSYKNIINWFRKYKIL